MKAHHWTLLGIVLLCAGHGGAQQRCVTVQPTKQQSYVAPSTALVPAYGGAYSSTDDVLLQILAEVKGLRTDVQALKSAQTGQGQAQQGALGIVATRCMSCHQDGVAKDKGGEFVMVEKDSTLAELSLGEKRRIIKMVTGGKMPPSGKLSEAEVKSLSEFFNPEKKEEKQK
jgi:cytochrome c553